MTSRSSRRLDDITAEMPRPQRLRIWLDIIEEINPGGAVTTGSDKHSDRLLEPQCQALAMADLLRWVTETHGPSELREALAQTAEAPEEEDLAPDLSLRGPDDLGFMLDTALLFQSWDFRGFIVELAGSRAEDTITEPGASSRRPWLMARRRSGNAWWSRKSGTCVMP